MRLLDAAEIGVSASTRHLAEVALGAATAGLALGAGAYAAMWPQSRLFGRALIAASNPPSGPREMALTFDDGPHPRWTRLLIDILARNNVRGTFFLLGKYAVSQRPLVQQLHRAGHLIGNHTWSHPNLTVTSLQRTREELYRTKVELEGIIGERVTYFRPPFGGRRPATFRLALELGMEPVLWNAMTADWKATAATEITSVLAKAAERNGLRGMGSNVVLHDGGHLSLEIDRSASVAAAGELIARFSATHRFVTLDAWHTAAERPDRRADSYAGAPPEG